MTDSKALKFQDWTGIRKALEAAYERLGLSMIKDDSGSHYQEDHWNIAGLVYEHIWATMGKCVHCSKSLNYHSVIRCLECKAPMCESCAVDHFGPGHVTRAASARGHDD